MPLTRGCMADSHLPMLQLPLYLSCPHDPSTHFIKPHFPSFPFLQSLITHILHFFPFVIVPLSPQLLIHYSSSLSTYPYQKSSFQLRTHKPGNKMCSSKAKVTVGIEATTAATATSPVARINGRPVLQPTCNRVPNHEKRNTNFIKKLPTKSLSPLSPPLPTKTSLTPPVSPKLKSPRPPATKRGNESNNGLNTSSEKILIPKTPTKTPTLERKKSKSFKDVSGLYANSTEASLGYSSTLITDSPGSIAAVRREQMALQHAQRKMKIAHYGRSKSAKFESVAVPLDPSSNLTSKSTGEEEKRCSFITANSDPIYIAYHDEEWGVPVHDDKMLFELLVLSGAQVGSDWTSILKKRQDFRTAFSEFDAATVANLTDKQMMSISLEYGIDISRVRGVVDNANRILEVSKDFGSFNKYVWGFVNHKPISTQYKFGHKIPVKTSKSESISKDMIRRGFRFVGPTVLHSFMQAAGLTNDHLITCHRHLQCTLLTRDQGRSYGS